MQNQVNSSRLFFSRPLIQKLFVLKSFILKLLILKQLISKSLTLSSLDFELLDHEILNFELKLLLVLPLSFMFCSKIPLVFILDLNDIFIVITASHAIRICHYQVLTTIDVVYVYE